MAGSNRAKAGQSAPEFRSKADGLWRFQQIVHLSQRIEAAETLLGIKPAKMISSCSRWLSPPIMTKRAWAITAG